MRFQQAFSVLTFLILLASCDTRSLQQGKHDQVAPFLETTSEEVAENHPKRVQEGTPGLPEGCITYEERYSQVERDPERYRNEDTNEKNLSARFVVLVRMHHEIIWYDDLVLFLRAIMQELSESGIHIYLLIEDAHGSQANPDDTPEKFVHHVPLSLRPIAYFFSAADIHNQYQKLHHFAAHEREYLPTIWFLHRYQGYDFAWVMEYDLRYTGPDFGHFLNSVLRIATDTLQQAGSGEEGAQSVLSESLLKRKALQGERKTIDEPASLLPDLVLMGDGIHSSPIDEKIKPRDTSNWNFTWVHHRQVQLFGMSKTFSDKIHQYALDGIGGYLEEFIPSIAKETMMNIVSIPHPKFIGDSFHCCSNVSEIYYADWFTSKECRQYALLHPIKMSHNLRHTHHLSGTATSW